MWNKLLIMNQRKCRLCNQMKPLKEFPNRIDGKDGIRTECKNCYSKQQHARYMKSGRRIWSVTFLYKHKIKGYKILIIPDELEEMSNNANTCQICEKTLDWNIGNKGVGKNNSNSPTLDRVNNDNEIRVDNIMIICMSCNTTKRDRTFQEFINYYKMVVNKHG